jgi:hypothetical protein
MADFNIRSESVDVEQIMRQIRGRINEKRGVDYTEEQVRELASVRLEKFLDPKNLRSDLLDQFKRNRPALPEPPPDPPPVEPPYAVDADMVYATHRAPLRFIRSLLRPILKLFINPHPIIEVLDKQAQFNVDMIKRDQRRKIEMQLQTQSFDRSRAEWNILYYEVLHNLVIETTRNGIELKNLKMRVEALASRLDFSERRVRALEGVVQYRPEVVRHRPSQGGGQPELAEGRERTRHGRAEPGAETPDPAAAVSGEAAPGSGGLMMTPAEGRRRRRRRRGRRPFGAPTVGAVANGEPAPTGDASAADDGATDSDDPEPDGSE